MTAYVTNALAACNTSKLTSNLQSMSHWHHSRPAQYQAALTYIERWFIFGNHQKWLADSWSNFLSFNRCEENHDDIGTIIRYVAFEHEGFELILWTILGLRKIVHHYPLETHWQKFICLQLSQSSIKYCWERWEVPFMEIATLGLFVFWMVPATVENISVPCIHQPLRL